MAPHSSTLAWKSPWTEEPGRLQSVWSRRVGHNWVTSLSLFTFMHWRRKWQPTPVFLPGESQGRGSLVGCRLWGRTELDATERLSSSSSREQRPLPLSPVPSVVHTAPRAGHLTWGHSTFHRGRLEQGGLRDASDCVLLSLGLRCEGRGRNDRVQK